MRVLRGFVLPTTMVLGVGLLLPADRNRSGAAEQAGAAVIQASKTHIDFTSGKNLVTRYVIDPKASKPYFWPLNALPGVSVTRAWPMEDDKGTKKDHDHPHHKSAWFCHGDVIPEGLEYKKHIKNVEGVDFWSETVGHGKIVCVRVDSPKTSKNQASIVTANEWRTAEGQKVLDETRTIHFYPFAPGANLLVLDVDLHASVCGITFGDTKEGSLGVRVKTSMRADRGKGVLINAEGKSGEGKGSNKDRAGCWGLVSAWCDYSGPADDAGTVAGISLFADPNNRIDTAWHARNYGLLAANPFGRKRSQFPECL
jgi:hypothetical protein